MSYNIDMTNLKFKDRLKELRLEKDLTQLQLSIATGLTQSCIAKWENGDRVPSIDAFIKLADYFDCSIDYLVGRED